MIRMQFYDFLCEELRRGGLWEWGKDRPYREVIAKPEIILAHERAWKRNLECPPRHDRPDDANA